MHGGHEHTPGEGREQGHDHGCHHHHHSVEPEQPGSVPERTVALLSYMLDHNRAHAEEIHELCHKLEAMGQLEAAALMGEGVSCYIDGNARMAEALEVLKGGNA